MEKGTTLICKDITCGEVDKSAQRQNPLIGGTSLSTRYLNVKLGSSYIMENKKENEKEDINSSSSTCTQNKR